MSAHASVLDLVGGTPLVRLNRLTEGIAAAVYVKLEYLNPGGSVKDRAATEMVLAARRSGALRPGGTIVEGTSGNTGVGLAQAAAALGHRIVVVLPDRTAVEKLDVLRAYGAEVVLTPSAVPREDPRHVEALAGRIAAETPGGWLANQYDNPANPAAHVRTTGPEIWADTGGAITHFVATIGTGGTISGTGRYLKQVSDGGVVVVGADPVASVYGGGDGSPYFVEAAGRYRHPATVDDTWPRSYDVDVPDRIESVPDRETIRTVWRLAAEEGLLVGSSAGLATAAALRVARPLGAGDTVVALLPDSGRNSLSTCHSPTWCRRLGFLDDDRPGVLGTDDVPQVRAAVAGTPADRVRLAAGQSVVPVVLAGRDPAVAPAGSEVLGELTADDLAELARAEVAVPSPPGPPPFTVGTGETPAEALARLDEAGASHAYLLRDGHVHGMVTRARLVELAAPHAARKP